jgi:hypothetical protein
VVQQPFDEGDPSQSHPIRTKSHGSEADPRPGRIQMDTYGTQLWAAWKSPPASS